MQRGLRFYFRLFIILKGLTTYLSDVRGDNLMTPTPIILRDSIKGLGLARTSEASSTEGCGKRMFPRQARTIVRVSRVPFPEPSGGSMSKCFTHCAEQRSNVASIRPGFLALAVAALLSVGLLSPNAAAAQSRGDYLLGRPKASLNLRVGAARPNASDGVFAVTGADGRRLLTLGPDQLVGASFGADIGIPVSQRVELQFSATIANRRAESEYRDFVDNNDLPIEQATRLRRAPLSVGIRYNLIPAGRRISRLAWVPAKLVPYVAAGGGAMYYKFQQEGDFVDFRSANLDVFTARLDAKGWAPLGYAATGLTWAVLPAVAVNTEFRYDHSRTPMKGDFTGFDKTALSGLGLSTGLQFRF